jgi:hypothetical protein
MWLGPPGLPFDTFDPEAQAMIVQKWYEGKQHGPGSSRQQQIQDHSRSVPDRHNHHQVVFPGVVFTFRADLRKRGLAGGLPTG